MADPVVTLFIIDVLGSFSVTTTLTGMAGIKLYPTIQGSGDAVLACYFGPLSDPNTGDIAPGLPAGFFPGVLADNLQGFTSLSPGAAFNYGSAHLIGDAGVSFPTVYGLTQTPDGWNTGRWLFIAEVIGVDVFSTDFGLGWGIAYNGGAGLDPNQWLSNGRASGASANGGAIIAAGGFNTYTPTFGAQGVQLAQPTGRHMGTLTQFGAAIAMDPPPPMHAYDPQKLVPQFMPCVPCCPTPCNGRYV